MGEKRRRIGNGGGLTNGDHLSMRRGGTKGREDEGRSDERRRKKDEGRKKDCTRAFQVWVNQPVSTKAETVLPPGYTKETSLF